MDAAAPAAVLTPHRPRGEAVAAWLRETAIVVVGCGIAGILVGGIGSRLAMRLAAIAAPEARGMVTENGNVVGDITVGGTFGLLVIAGVGSAIVGAAAALVLRPWLPRRTVARGLVFGGFLLPLGGGVVVDAGNADFSILGDDLLNVTVLSMLFVAFGLVAAGTIGILEGRVPPAAALTPRRWGLSMLCALAVVPGFALLLTQLAPERALLLVGAWAGMHAGTALARSERTRAAGLTRGLATAAMLLAVGLAGAEFVAGVRLIV
ncbi:MAG: hypothetical protein ACRDG8_05665 [Actinomycetota bacterium]